MGGDPTVGARTAPLPVLPGARFASGKTDAPGQTDAPGSPETLSGTRDAQDETLSRAAQERMTGFAPAGPVLGFKLAEAPSERGAYLEVSAPRRSRRGRILPVVHGAPQAGNAKGLAMARFDPVVATKLGSNGEAPVRLPDVSAFDQAGMFQQQQYDEFLRKTFEKMAGRKTTDPQSPDIDPLFRGAPGGAPGGPAGGPGAAGEAGPAPAPAKDTGNVAGTAGAKEASPTAEDAPVDPKVKARVDRVREFLKNLPEEERKAAQEMLDAALEGGWLLRPPTDWPDGPSLLEQLEQVVDQHEQFVKDMADVDIESSPEVARFNAQAVATALEDEARYVHIRDVLAKLPPAERAAAEEALEKAADAGTLGKEDASGKTVLDYLEQIAQQKMDPALAPQRARLLKEAIEQVADPKKSIVQKRGTYDCGITEYLIYLAGRRPADFVRQIAELAGPEGKTTLPDGTVYLRHPEWGKSTQSTLTQQLLTPSLTEFVNGPLRHDPATGMNVVPDTPEFKAMLEARKEQIKMLRANVEALRSSGDPNLAEMARSLEHQERYFNYLVGLQSSHQGIFGEELAKLYNHSWPGSELQYKLVIPEKSPENLARLKTAMTSASDGQTLPVSLRYPDGTYHQVQFQRFTDDGKAQFVDPHGEIREMDADQFLANIGDILVLDRGGGAFPEVRQLPGPSLIARSGGDPQSKGKDAPGEASKADPPKAEPEARDGVPREKDLPRDRDTALRAEERRREAERARAATQNRSPEPPRAGERRDGAKPANREGPALPARKGGSAPEVTGKAGQGLVIPAAKEPASSLPKHAAAAPDAAKPNPAAKQPPGSPGTPATLPAPTANPAAEKPVGSPQAPVAPPAGPQSPAAAKATPLAAAGSGSPGAVSVGLIGPRPQATGQPAGGPGLVAQTTGQPSGPARPTGVGPGPVVRPDVTTAFVRPDVSRSLGKPDVSTYLAGGPRSPGTRPLGTPPPPPAGAKAGPPASLSVAAPPGLIPPEGKLDREAVRMVLGSAENARQRTFGLLKDADRVTMVVGARPFNAGERASLERVRGAARFELQTALDDVHALERALETNGQLSAREVAAAKKALGAVRADLTDRLGNLTQLGKLVAEGRMRPLGAAQQAELRGVLDKLAPPAPRAAIGPAPGTIRGPAGTTSSPGTGPMAGIPAGATAIRIGQGPGRTTLVAGPAGQERVIASSGGTPEAEGPARAAEDEVRIREAQKKQHSEKEQERLAAQRRAERADRERTGKAGQPDGVNHHERAGDEDLAELYDDLIAERQAASLARLAASRRQT